MTRNHCSVGVVLVGLMKRLINPQYEEYDACSGGLVLWKRKSNQKSKIHRIKYAMRIDTL